MNGYRALVIAIPAGPFAAVERYSAYDHFATVAVLLYLNPQARIN